ncbi:DNA-binding transcriptional LysR family regulator [Amorphus suaedae]
MRDGLTGIDIFVTVVEAGSFAAAAERVNLTRSAVAKTIGRLEVRLGVRLFHRTTRSQHLTEDGQLYFERCVRALAELAAGAAMLESGRHEVTGRLRVSVPVLFGRRCVAPILADFAARHAKLELHISFSDRPVDLVEDGFDLAIRNAPVETVPGLTMRRVATQQMVVCASPAYLAAHGGPASLDGLDTHHAITYVRAGRTAPWRFPVEDGERHVFPPSRMSFDDLEAIADATAAGHGLTWLPGWLVADRLANGELVTLLDTVPGLVLETSALWPQTHSLPLRVRLALDALVEDLPKRCAG